VKRKKDYYIILGVSRTESSSGIRDAFRRLAKKYHPDHAGQECTRFFQEITEAYDILSDPEARKSYTENLHREEERERRSRPSFREERSSGGWFDFDDFDPFEELLQALLRNRSGFEGRRDAHRSPGEIEVVLSEAEAERGVSVPLQVPVILRCPFCAGTGHTGFFHCLRCGGQGFAEIFEEIDLPIPAGVEDGTLFEIPVGRIAGTLLSIRVRIRVRAEEK
jgi:DnaJ-class molecular chaperone